MNTEEIFKQSGYTIPTNKHDECSKRFDYWDMIAFADLVTEKLKEQDSNLSQHLVIWRCNESLYMNSGKEVFTKGNTYKEVDNCSDELYNNFGEEHILGGWEEHFTSI